MIYFLAKLMSATKDYLSHRETLGNISLIRYKYTYMNMTGVRVVLQINVTEMILFILRAGRKAYAEH